MSEFSKEISGLIDQGIDKSIQELSARLLDYGKYTYNSMDVRRRHNQLTYYTSLENFLAEYVEGEEEMTSRDLLTISRIANSSVRAGGNVAQTSNTTIGPENLFNDVSFKVNGESVSGVYMANINEVLTLEASYHGSMDVGFMTLGIDSLNVTEEAPKVFTNNYKLTDTGEIIHEVFITVIPKGFEQPVAVKFAIILINYNNVPSIGFDYTYPVALGGGD